jgi:histidinol dehydrogenase
MKRLVHGAKGFQSTWAQLCARGEGSDGDAEVEATARQIVDDVRARGDEALLAWTERLDRWTPASASSLDVGGAELEAAVAAVGRQGELAQSLSLAAARIRAYHEHQRPEGWEGELEPGDGLRVGWRVEPLRRVGVYVPGGTAAYPSTVLMNVIPAKVAGVAEVIVATPTPDGRTSDIVLAACAEAGADRVLRMGGAQAIGALAHGTRTVPRCDAIVGPGNAWVAAAKRLVSRQVAIDMEAGPSEVLIVADSTANPEHIAADLLAQAEHDPRAVAGLIAVAAPGLGDEVLDAVERRLGDLPRAEIARRSLAERGFVIDAPDRASAAALADDFAAEHLELLVEQPRELLAGIGSAGAVFIGPWTPEALGDYLAGPNHVLPTAGTARFASPLGVWNFVKRTSIVEASREGLARVAPHIEALAEAEGLDAHARAVAARGGEG